MAERGTHEALVEAQFGVRAAAYLESKVHAQGPDLARLTALFAGRGGDHVLDLGSGAGHVTFAVAPLVASVTACDLSGAMLAVLREAAAARHLKNVATCCTAAESLPFHDAVFDAVLSRYSAHHWRDLDLGLREAARVLRPGGVLAVIDTLSPGLAEFDTHLQAVELLRDPSHVRDYSAAEWEEAMARTGLRARAVTVFSVRLDFASWTERMQTPPVRAEAIRALQRLAPTLTVQRFKIGAEGSFSIDVALMEAVKPEEA